MQFLKIGKDTTLSALGQAVGSRNVTSMLVQNQLSRSVNIGQQYYDNCKNIINTAPPVSWQDKQVILNKFVSDYNVFEEAALLGDSGWKVLKNLDAFPNAIQIYNKEQMTGRGRGKYMYKSMYKKYGENFFIENLSKYFPQSKIVYIV